MMRLLLGAFLFLCASSAVAQTPSRVRATALLDDIAHGFHPGAAGYLDIFHANSLRPGTDYERPYGTLEGYVQRRRVAFLMQDPDSLAPTRWGLLGAWDQGGWTDDTYFGWPDGSHEDIVLWTGGVAWARPSLEADAVVGFTYGRKVSWKGEIDDGTVEPSRTSWFGLGRWRRFSELAVVDGGGIRHLRLGYEPATGSVPPGGAFLASQIQGALHWSQPEWNRWEAVEAWGAEVGVPLWMDRILLRAHGGDEGFRQVRLECDLAAEGVVGLDISYARNRSGRTLPGVRVRIPLFTLGWNDPEDAALYGADARWPVWSARLQMVWDGPEVYYRPGRRPSHPEKR